MYELLQSIQGIAKMELRPTGLLDPNIEVRPTEGQVADLLSEINLRIERGERCLVTVLTIKFAEEVAEYLNRMGVGHTISIPKLIPLNVRKSSTPSE